MTKLSILGFVSTSDFLSLSRLQSSVPTLIGSSVRIFKERVASFATRFDILQKSNRFRKWLSKLFVFSLPEALPILHESSALPLLSSSLLSAKGAHYGGQNTACQILLRFIFADDASATDFSSKKSVDVFFSGQPIRD